MAKRTARGIAVTDVEVGRVSQQLETDIRIRRLVLLRVEADKLEDHFKAWSKRAKDVEAGIDLTEKLFAARQPDDQAEMFPADDESDEATVEQHRQAIAMLREAADLIGEAE